MGCQQIQGKFLVCIILINVFHHLFHHIIIPAAGSLISDCQCFLQNSGNVMDRTIAVLQGLLVLIGCFQFLRIRLQAFQKICHTEIDIHGNILPENIGLQCLVAEIPEKFFHEVDHFLPVTLF